MNINVYIEDNLAKQIKECAAAMGKSRNFIIRQALKEWLAYHKIGQWPASIQKFKGIRDFPAFEAYREELARPKEDPFK